MTDYAACAVKRVSDQTMRTRIEQEPNLIPAVPGIHAVRSSI
jgi:hypothetical protein